MIVVTTAEMRELDRITIEELGLPGALLMEHAGRSLAEEVARGLSAPARVAVCCGPGNNGGDGYSCARWLRERGHAVRVYLCAARPRLGSDAALHLAAFERFGGQVVDVTTADALGRARDEIWNADVIVDALLGTGLRSEVRGYLAEVIAFLNQSSAPKICADVPSGINSDTGQVLGIAVDAHRTVTFGFAKLGLVSWPGCERVGELRVADIGIPRSHAERVGAKRCLLDKDHVRRLLPRRPRGGHKGTFGHVLVVAGSRGKTGAALLCAEGALRGGAGLVTCAVPPSVHPQLEGRVREAMCAELDHDLPSAEGLAALAALATGKDALAWGPGIPVTPRARELVRHAVSAIEVPMVLDADALNHLEGHVPVLRAARVPVVLTPHPGEAARLLGVSVADVQADRVSAAERLSAASGATVVLKGARTVVAEPGGRVAINPTGNPGMGTGGTGDVLCGLVAALIGQGLPPFDAACVGVHAHGLAGDVARDQLGEMGLMAGDLLSALPGVLRGLSE
ncbi:MAG: NAD(P)H-hydrate dehydratase [Deltaproteobacteria bacterium]|nr:NAD(P)H-hydrate dehydratase [Deltaproteobacteria bacterium]